MVHVGLGLVSLHQTSVQRTRTTSQNFLRPPNSNSNSTSALVSLSSITASGPGLLSCLPFSSIPLSLPLPFWPVPARRIGFVSYLVGSSAHRQNLARSFPAQPSLLPSSLPLLDVPRPLPPISSNSLSALRSAHAQLSAAAHQWQTTPPPPPPRAQNLRLVS